jgi:hypothetical protein
MVIWYSNRKGVGLERGGQETAGQAAVGDSERRPERKEGGGQRAINQAKKAVDKL